MTAESTGRGGESTELGIRCPGVVSVLPAPSLHKLERSLNISEPQFSHLYKKDLTASPHGAISTTNSLAIKNGSNGGLDSCFREMYEFPVVAVTHYHKLSGLKKHRFIMLEF